MLKAKTDPRIAAKPLKIVLSPHFRRDLYFKGKPHLEEPFLDIFLAIQNGTPLPKWAYRRDIDTTDDALLRREGIMHLHLGSQGSNELLFLLQFEAHVTLLEISDHRHFQTDPPGTLLVRLHEAKVAAYHAHLAEEEAAATGRLELEAAKKRHVLMKAVKAGIKPQKP
ncbi:hypothetical protein G8E10_23305 [Rhizobiaceae bacterium CRRU44]|uniref:Uncharacterized protein n=1 Tax=Ferranicluibacter rubi TaxID=2715133 RepID=A0AA43ZLH5_9HYPH|nr:hypothetical protein [Ferranicluibacter rubi]NHT78631.1 hypothetical protein [Ferranicluibacter rubi]